MIKVKIVLDEEKIIRERKYSLEKIWNVIDNAFLSKNIRIEEKGLYVGTDHPHDYANFGLVCMGLEDQEWFFTNVKEWKFFNNAMLENKYEYAEEDFLKQAKLYKAGFR